MQGRSQRHLLACVASVAALRAEKKIAEASRRARCAAWWLLPLLLHELGLGLVLVLLVAEGLALWLAKRAVHEPGGE